MINVLHGLKIKLGIYTSLISSIYKCNKQLTEQEKINIYLDNKLKSTLIDYNNLQRDNIELSKEVYKLTTKRKEDKVLIDRLNNQLKNNNITITKMLTSLENKRKVKYEN